MSIDLLDRSPLNKLEFIARGVLECSQRPTPRLALGGARERDAFRQQLRVFGLVVLDGEGQPCEATDKDALIAWSITAAVLLCAPAITRVLKEKGSMAVERLMGMLLVMVAVQMFLNGIEFYLKR